MEILIWGRPDCQGAQRATMGPGCGGRGVLQEGGAGTGGLGRHGGPGPPGLGLGTSAATRQSPWSPATTMLASH